MWWVRTTVKTDALPAGRTVIHFRFRGAPEKLRYFWLVLPEADLCLTDPGFGVDVTVTSDPKTLTAVGWETSGRRARQPRHRTRRPASARALLPDWFGLHPLFASVEHPTNRPRVSA